MDANAAEINVTVIFAIFNISVSTIAHDRPICIKI